MTAGTTGVMVLVLLLFAGLIALNFMSSTVVTGLRDKVDISAYFKIEAPEENILAVKGDLESQPFVKSVEYISRAKALEDFRAKHVGDPLIQESLAELDDNPLQASLNIKVVAVGQFPQLIAFLEANTFRSLIDKIDFYENEQVIEKIESISRGLSAWGLIVTLVLTVIAVLVTFNTIRLTIYNQKQEIEIMRLVGGSNWHIRAPFLVEGGLYGLVAAVIAVVVFYPSVYALTPKVARFMPDVDLFGYFIANIGQFLLLVFGAGILLGVISSAVAIRRFLRV